MNTIDILEYEDDSNSKNKRNSKMRFSVGNK